jgi:hypothetical protein
LRYYRKRKRADQNDLNSLVEDPFLTSDSPKLSLPSLPIEHKGHIQTYAIQGECAGFNHDLLLFDPS